MPAAVHSAVLNCKHIGLSSPHWFSFYDFYCVKTPSNKKKCFLSHCGQAFSSYKQKTLSLPWHSLRIIRLPNLLRKFLPQIENCRSFLLHAHHFILPTAGSARLASKYTQNYFHTPLALWQHPKDYWTSISSKIYSSLSLPQSWCYFSHAPLQLHSVTTIFFY